METDTNLKKSVAFSLLANSYNGKSPAIDVSFDDLRAAKVGKKWENHDVHSCGRALYEESAEVVYKTSERAVVLFRSWGTTDDPNPEHWEAEPNLVRFDFAEEAGKCDG